MKRLFNIFNLFFIALIIFAGCKKGEEDPNFSFRTRKDRLTGDWILTRGFISSTNKNSTVNTTYSNSTYITTSSQNPELVIEGNYSRTLSINKEGNFIDETYKDDQFLKMQGEWTFLSGNKSDDLKNKEAVLFKITSQFNSFGNILNQYEGDKRPLITVRLKNLSNTEIVWTSNGTMDDQVTESELTWKLR